MGSNPHANGGALLEPLRMPDYAGYAVEVSSPGSVNAENTRVLGSLLRDIFRDNREARNFRLFCPDETTSNRLQAVFDVTLRAFEWPLAPTDEYPLPATAASWRFSASTAARVGSKAIC